MTTGRAHMHAAACASLPLLNPTMSKNKTNPPPQTKTPKPKDPGATRRRLIRPTPKRSQRLNLKVFLPPRTTPQKGPGNAHVPVVPFTLLTRAESRHYSDTTTALLAPAP